MRKAIYFKNKRWEVISIDGITKYDELLTVKSGRKTIKVKVDICNGQVTEIANV